MASFHSCCIIFAWIAEVCSIRPYAVLIFSIQQEHKKYFQEKWKDNCKILTIFALSPWIINLYRSCRHQFLPVFILSAFECNFLIFYISYFHDLQMAFTEIIVTFFIWTYGARYETNVVDGYVASRAVPCHTFYDDLVWWLLIYVELTFVPAVS